jgi:hypothetical protein
MTASSDQASSLKVIAPTVRIPKAPPARRG